MFGSRGAAASTEEIARQAQVSIATVFRHFPTKQDLIEATAARYLDKLADEARRLSEGTDPGKAFASLLRTLVSTGATKMTLMDLLPPHGRDGDGLSQPVNTAADGFRDAVGSALARAQTAGAARPDVTFDEVSVLLRALAHVATPDEGEAFDRAVGIVLDGLGVPR